MQTRTRKAFWLKGSESLARLAELQQILTCFPDRHSNMQVHAKASQNRKIQSLEQSGRSRSVNSFTHANLKRSQPVLLLLYIEKKTTSGSMLRSDANFISRIRWWKHQSLRKKRDTFSPPSTSPSGEKWKCMMKPMTEEKKVIKREHPIDKGRVREKEFGRKPPSQELTHHLGVMSGLQHRELNRHLNYNLGF